MTNTNKDQENTSFDEQSRFDELVEHYPYLKEARDYGVDIQMLMDNADRTPAERLRRHQSALNALNMLKGARKL
ncbi:MAG: hypothetical protein FVQ82_05390 [Planctomycetes bacterium]|nr:hypothetical protein [Planctomycetota bacterium]